MQLFEMRDVFLDRTACQFGNAQVLAVGADRQILLLDAKELLVALEVGRDTGRVKVGSTEGLKSLQVVLPAHRQADFQFGAITPPFA